MRQRNRFSALTIMRNVRAVLWLQTLAWYYQRRVNLAIWMYSNLYDRLYRLSGGRVGHLWGPGEVREILRKSRRITVGEMISTGINRWQIRISDRRQRRFRKIVIAFRK
ncbi:MAG: hypothetical protein UY63_C0003G0035 [Parcubacteria group bacterium GW2011_GWA2_51_10]|nr:MAG: hypothetical protein UY63_C0003G0035 [Parcubacteria group bacterium GW2011_GWA2_51_10]